MSDTTFSGHQDVTTLEVILRVVVERQETVRCSTTSTDAPWMMEMWPPFGPPGNALRTGVEQILWAPTLRYCRQEAKQKRYCSEGRHCVPCGSESSID